MRRRSAQVAAFLCLCGLASAGCSRKCVRHSECNRGESCSNGVCLLVVHRDAADAPGVGSMTDGRPPPPPGSGGAPAAADASIDVEAGGG